jgi:hypothetical protein
VDRDRQSRKCQATAAPRARATTHLELEEHEIKPLVIGDERRSRGAVRAALRRRAVGARFRRIPHVSNDHRERALALRQRRCAGTRQYRAIQREQHRRCYAINVQLGKHRSHLARLEHRGDAAALSYCRSENKINKPEL